VSATTYSENDKERGHILGKEWILLPVQYNIKVYQVVLWHSVFETCVAKINTNIYFVIISSRPGNVVEFVTL
jgi:hypothetical protein